MIGLDDWESETNYEEVSIADLDEAVRAFTEARDDYDEKKKVSNEADAVCKEAKRRLIELLKRSGKKNWELEGVGKAIKTERLSYTTPKDLEAKKALAKYIEETHGKDTFWSMFGINHKTLNSWANQELENNPEANIPGLEAPVANENIQFRRTK